MPRRGVSYRREMGTHLVRAARLQARLDQRVPGKQFEHGEPRACLAGRQTTERAAFRGPVVPAQRSVDDARARPRVTLDQRQIRPLDLARLDLGAEEAM